MIFSFPTYKIWRKQPLVHRDLMRVNRHGVYAILSTSLADLMLINSFSSQCYYSAIIALIIHHYLCTEWLNNFWLLTGSQNSHTSELLKMKTVNIVKRVNNSKSDHNPRSLPVRSLANIFLATFYKNIYVSKCVHTHNFSLKKRKLRLYCAYCFQLLFFLIRFNLLIFTFF